MTHRKTHEEIEQELDTAKKLVKIGGIYSHFKNPQNHYEVIDLAMQEATEKVCVIYRALYGKHLLFVRDLDIWLKQPEMDGKNVSRFTLIED